MKIRRLATLDILKVYAAVFLLMIGGCVMAETSLSGSFPLQPFWKVLGDHAYAFFMAQFFVWSPMHSVIANRPEWFVAHGNLKILLLALLLCSALTILLQDGINAPIQRAVRKHFSRNQNG